MTKSIHYQNYLTQSLQNVEEAAGYLNTVLHSGDSEDFLLALQHVVKAQGGVTKLAEKTQKSSAHLYTNLLQEGTLYLKTTHQILAAMGMHLMIDPISTP